MSLRVPILSYFSFVPKNFNYNSIIFKIIKVFFIAILLSNCIYLSFYDNIYTQTLSPLLSIWGLVLLLRQKAKGYFWVGVLVGIFWFWWLGLSSIYFDLTYLVPVIILLVGLVYGILFRICHLFHFDLLRLSAIFCLSYIHPIGFDWLNWGILTVPGFFDSNLQGSICLFLIAYFYYERFISRYYKMAIITAIFFIGFHYDIKESQSLNLRYELVNTDINQGKKYINENKIEDANILLYEIQKAIDNKKELVILPESAFAFDLKNAYEGEFHKELLELSKKITIITGAFNTDDDNEVFNSTYIYASGILNVLDKHYLVPFGEYIPYFSSLVRKWFLPNMQEFSQGPLLSQYKLKNQLITNAICYEATKEAIYKKSKLIIAISNNAWFNYSSEYKLQQLLMRYYANKYGVSIYHATNGKENAVIRPKTLLYKEWENKFNDISQKAKALWQQLFG
ncbi:apolipoprotein N-acyltransferase [Campylobacter sp. LR286c]|uniref:apolipoprotein N-acyltransferase n=1 Tax=Campylobacter sp. LR286c TaxID=2593545 RepID=UPI0012381F04|nr:apolipoprotein N-acyltransferase [Campylobacter sp. LR286c]KAA6228545.1 apolipoprotein N-acyltransferase [Campylobacter sp. LR286c]